MTEFTRRQVEIAIRRFRDYADDVAGSVHQTFDENFGIFIDHCENDPVMKAITSQLVENSNLNFESWYEDFKGRGRGVLGSSSFRLPRNEEDRLSLLYQLLVRIEANDPGLLQFSMLAFGGRDLDSLISIFCEQVFRGFVRDIGYRFDGLLESIQNNDMVSLSSLNIFQHVANQVIMSNVSNSNVAVDNSQVSVTTCNTTVIKEFLLGLAVEIKNSGGSSKAFEALKTLADATGNEPKSQLAATVETAIVEEPGLRQKLLDFLRNVGASITGSAVIEAMRYVLT